MALLEVENLQTHFRTPSGINRAVANKWITVHHRDRYRYILTEEGYTAGRQTGAPVPVTLQG